MQDSTSREGTGIKRRSLLTALAVSPLVLAGCMANQGKQSGPGEMSAFPVTVDHAFGSTKIDAAPQRIATIGYASHDACIALGVVPVGVPQYEERGFGTSLWFNKAVTSMNAATPGQYRVGKDLPLDELEDLKPDVILAVNSGITRKQYEELSRIAPVVAYPGEPFGTDWRTTTTTVGTVLGKPQAAQDLVRDVADGITKAKSSYDDLAGSTFLYMAASTAPGADFEVYGPDTNQVRILEEYGIVPAPVLQEVVSAGKRRKVETGPAPYLWESRRAGELVADIYVVAVGDKDNIIKDGILDGLPGAQRGSLALLKNSDDALTLAEASPLGIKWATWTVLPELARSAYLANSGR
ncbi:ABC transporter substrate-binding protein [Pseudarthrobacter enclensis]|uniref:ABC transporter substrate-binding protein n=1 Tax=Pseudarthrobacter enclensis TaxID=993070 RepID=UPI003431663C